MNFQELVVAVKMSIKTSAELENTQIIKWTDQYGRARTTIFTGSEDADGKLDMAIADYSPTFKTWGSSSMTDVFTFATAVSRYIKSETGLK